MSSYRGGGQAGQAFADNFLRAFGMVQQLKFQQRQEQRQAGLDAQEDDRYRAEQAHRAQREAKADDLAERSYGLQLNADQRAGESHGEAMATSRQKRGLVDRQLKFGDALTRLSALPEDAPPEVKGEAARRLVLDATGYDMAEMLGQDWQDSFAHLQKVQAGKERLRTRATIDAARVVLGPALNRPAQKVEKAYKTRDGKTIPAGSTIVKRELADIIPYQGALTFDLDVTVQLPDGTTTTYGAPMTAGRSTDAADGVKPLEVGDVLRYVMGLDKLQQAAKHMLEGGYLTTAGAASPRALGGRGGGAGSAQLAYAQAFANSEFGKKHFNGDVGAAIAWLKANPVNAKAAIVKNLMAQQDRLRPRYTQQEATELADKMVDDMLQLQGTDEAAQADEAADATTAPAAVSHEGMTQVGTTPDGKPVYEDAQGNRFVEE